MQCNVLVAYPYLCKMDVSAVSPQEGVRLLVDCGAFTAYKSGKEIRLDDYCRFLESLPFKPFGYFSLDVIGDPDKTTRNYQIMLERGFKPIPVFTASADTSIIDELYETTDYIALGGIATARTDLKIPLLQRAFRTIRERKVHLLGVTNSGVLRKYKPYSCDSSSWLQGSRYGSCALYGGRARFISVKKKDFEGKPRQEVLDLVRRYGFSCRQIAQKSFWTGRRISLDSSNILSAVGWVAYAADIERSLKTKVFEASASYFDVASVKFAMSHLNKLAVA